MTVDILLPGGRRGVSKVYANDYICGFHFPSLELTVKKVFE